MFFFVHYDFRFNTQKMAINDLIKCITSGIIFCPMRDPVVLYWYLKQISILDNIEFEVILQDKIPDRNY